MGCLYHGHAHWMAKISDQTVICISCIQEIHLSFVFLCQKLKFYDFNCTRQPIDSDQISWDEERDSSQLKQSPSTDEQK